MSASTTMKLTPSLGAAFVIVFLAGCSTLLPNSSQSSAVPPKPPSASDTPAPLASVDSPDNPGLSPLHHAALSGNAAQLRSLLYAGADPNATDRLLGYAPLHLAASGGHVEAIQVLIASGARLNAPTIAPLPHLVATQLTPLHLAVRVDRLAAVQVLLKSGADVNVRDVQGATPLHMALTNYGSHTAALVRVLLSAGADAKARDKRGRRPIDMPKVYMLELLDQSTHQLLHDAAHN